MQNVIRPNIALPSTGRRGSLLGQLRDLTGWKHSLFVASTPGICEPE